MNLSESTKIKLNALSWHADFSRYHKACLKAFNNTLMEQLNSNFDTDTLSFDIQKNYNPDLASLILAPDNRRKVQALSCMEERESFSSHEIILENQGTSIRVLIAADFIDSDKILSKVKASIDFMESASTPAFNFFRLYTREIKVLKDRTRDSFWSSSPERKMLGTYLWNINPQTCTIESIVDALLHEAVHSYLDINSLLRAQPTSDCKPWMSNQLMYDGISRLQSPWTGAPLSVPIFIHACFVWFSLASFWAGVAMAEISYNRGAARHLFSRAIRGFKNRPDLLIAQFHDDVSSDLIRNINAMTLSINQACQES